MFRSMFDFSILEIGFSFMKSSKEIPKALPISSNVSIEYTGFPFSFRTVFDGSLTGNSGSYF